MSTPLIVILSKIFAAMIMFYMSLIFMKTKKVPSFDYYTIGYVEDDSVNHISINVQENADYKSTQLYADCRDSLVALGIKKREANKKTNDVFQRQVPKDISSFLKEALK